jgi:hypothetical protein
MTAGEPRFNDYVAFQRWEWHLGLQNRTRPPCALIAVELFARSGEQG